MELWVGCVAGALEEREYTSKWTSAGFRPTSERGAIACVYEVEEARAFWTESRTRRVSTRLRHTSRKSGECLHPRPGSTRPRPSLQPQCLPVIANEPESTVDFCRIRSDVLNGGNGNKFCFRRRPRCEWLDSASLESGRDRHWVSPKATDELEQRTAHARDLDNRCRRTHHHPSPPKTPRRSIEKRFLASHIGS